MVEGRKLRVKRWGGVGRSQNIGKHAPPGPLLKLRAGGFEEKAAPADEEADSAEGSDRAEPMLAGGGEQVERAGEEDNADKKTPPGEGFEGLTFGKDKQHDSVDEMIKGGLLPNFHRSILNEDGFHPMRAERAQYYGEKAHEGGDAGGEGLRHRCHCSISLSMSRV